MASNSIIKQKLQKLDNYDFEKLVADLWEKQGWSTEVEQESGDAGIDVRATKTNPFDQKVLIQAKRYDDSTVVGGPDVQQYASLKLQEPNVDTVIIITTSRFTKEAKNRAEELNVKLINGNELSQLINQLAAADVLEKYSEASQSDLKNNTTISDETSNRSDNTVKNWSIEVKGRRCSANQGLCVYNGSVYVVSGIQSKTSCLISLDEETGTKEWSRSFGKTELLNDNLYIKNDNIYIGTRGGKLYCLTTNRRQNWKFDAGDLINSLPTVSDEVVYFGSNDGHMYAVDINTGNKKWDYSTGGFIASPGHISFGHAVSKDEDLVYCIKATEGKSLIALDMETGSREWYTHTSDFQPRTRPVVCSQYVCVGTFDNGVQVLDKATGSQEKVLDTDEVSVDAIFVHNSRGRKTILSVHQKKYIAFDLSDGEKKWEINNRGRDKVRPICYNKKIYIPQSKKIDVFRSSGSKDSSIVIDDTKVGFISLSISHGNVIGYTDNNVFSAPLKNN